MAGRRPINLVHNGTILKALFTNMNGSRYVSVMLWIVAATALAASPAQSSGWQPSSSTAQATASIRIISGVTLKLDAVENLGAPAAHDSMVTTETGLVRPARLIEFE